MSLDSSHLRILNNADLISNIELVEETATLNSLLTISTPITFQETLKLYEF